MKDSVGRASKFNVRNNENEEICIEPLNKQRNNKLFAT